MGKPVYELGGLGLSFSTSLLNELGLVSGMFDPFIIDPNTNSTRLSALAKFVFPS